MATPFYIQWREQTDGSGAFYGSSSQPFVWQSLSDFRLSKNTSYEFHFSVVGVIGDRFISLTEDGGPRVGVRLDSADDESNPVGVGPITLGDKALKFMAARLGAFDPKFPTTWGKGGTTKVDANWSGQVWTIAIEGGTPQTGTDMVVHVSTGSSIEFVIKDAARAKHWAALVVLSSVDVPQSTILHETDLATKSDSSDTYTVPQPTGATTTVFGLNLYEVLATTVVSVV